jgi:hypothetical protein
MSSVTFETAYWGDTTDPMHHNADDYRYLVHALNPQAKANALLAASIDEQNGILYDPAWGNQAISLYDTPEQVVGRVSVSMSLVNVSPDKKEHTRTYGDAGLILAAPTQNVMVTSPTGVGTHNGNRAALLESAARTPIISGDELVNKTEHGDLNEVVALGDYNGQQLQLLGFFYKTTEGRLHNPYLTQMMLSHARRLGKPIIKIVRQ